MPAYTLGDLLILLPEKMLTPSIRRMLDKGWYEIEEAKALRAHLRDGDRVLELGGGAGFLAALSASRVGAKNVTTVEANPEMVPIIEGNLARNGQADATIIHGVVSEEPKQSAVDFFVPEDFWAATAINTNQSRKRVISVPSVQLSDLLERYQPTVLIVDVEGAERDYFINGLPSGVRLIVIELHPDQYERWVIGEMFSRLAQQGFIYQPRGSHGAVVVFEK